ncbi:MAG: hypothetical protein ACREUR_09180 [Nitrosospira sp.]
MKHVFILQYLTARSVALASILIFTAASLSHAQTGTAGQGSASTPEPHGSKAAQPGREDSPGAQENAQPKEDVHAPGQGTAGADASLNEECTAQEADACEPPAPEEKSFLRRMIKLFYGPDRPPGPDPDVDTNISAGGAGGG